MFCDFNALSHLGVQNLSPYVAGTSIDEVIERYGIRDVIKLASNENPYGCSEAVSKVLQNSNQEVISRYPSIQHHPLRNALASFYELNVDNIMLANGSDVFYMLLLMCFAVNNNKHMLTHDYAFLTYSIQAKALAVPIVQVPLQQNWQVDIEALIKSCNSNTAVLFLANPNNPTGAYLEIETIEYLLKHIPHSTLCVLDEAYHEFIEHKETDPSITLLKRYPNLVITRTFSKAYGLAGLRLGYALAHENILAVLQKAILPFTVSQLTLNAGLAALSDQDFVQHSVRANNQERPRIQQALEHLNFISLPAHANFITIDTGQDSLKLYHALLKKGVIVRPLHAYGLTNYLRISIGTPAENTRMLETMAECINLYNLES